MKTYQQYCPVAHALGLVGERWALLIVRDLLKGPKRYTDLAAGLPGIGTNILAARLRHLEDAGIVAKKKLPPPAPATVYELTDYGRELDEVMTVLGRWGARSLGPPTEHDCLPAGWSVDAVRRTVDMPATRGLHATYELRLGGEEVTTVDVADGLVEAQRGPAQDPDVVVEMDPATMFELVSRALSTRDALESGRARLVHGKRRDFEQLMSLFSFDPVGAAA